MKTKLTRLMCLLFAFTMLISLWGCKKGEVASSSSETPLSSEESVDESSSEQAEDEEISSEEDYIEDESYEDFQEEENFEEVSSEQEPYIPDRMLYANNITVYNTEAPISENFLGLNGVYQCFPFMEIIGDRTYTEKQRNTELSRVTQMGVKMVRTFYKTEYAYDANNNKFDWDTDNMQAIYKWMHHMQDNNISVALNAGWEMSVFYKDDANASGVWDKFQGVFVKGDPEKSAKNYADWMVESLKQFKARGINNIDYLMMFTEPGGFNSVRFNEEYKDKSIYDIEDPRFKTWLRLVKALDSELKQNDMRKDYLLVGPNEAHRFYSEKDGTYFMPMLYNALTQANDYIDIFSAHNYPTVEDIVSDILPSLTDLYWKERVVLTKDLTGKPFWVDETGIKSVDEESGNPSENYKTYNWHAMQMAMMMTSTMNMGVQNTIIWSLASQNWNSYNTNNDGYHNGVQDTGLFPSVYLSDIPYVSYYGTSLLTKHFGFGGKVYPIDAGWLFASCEETENGDWTVLVVNSGFEETDFKLEFDKGVGDKTFYRYVYDTVNQVATPDAKPIGADKGIRSDNGLFYDTLPGGSFAVYTTVKPE